jgi:hypothetical protein
MQYVPSRVCQVVSGVVKNGSLGQYFNQVKTRHSKKYSKCLFSYCTDLYSYK